MQERRLLGANEIGDKFGLHPISAASILGILPRSWKETLRKDKPTLGDEGRAMENLNQINKIASYAYNALNVTGDEDYKRCHDKWKAELAVSTIDWERVYRRVYYPNKDIPVKRLMWRLTSEAW